MLILIKGYCEKFFMKDELEILRKDKEALEKRSLSYG